MRSAYGAASALLVKGGNVLAAYSRFYGRSVARGRKKARPHEAGRRDVAWWKVRLPFNTRAAQGVGEENGTAIAGTLVCAQIVEVEHVVHVNGERVVEAGVAAG